MTLNAPRQSETILIAVATYICMADSVRMEMPLGYVTLESGRVQY